MSRPTRPGLRAPTVSADHLALTLWLDPHQDRFRGELTMEISLANATDRIEVRAIGLRLSESHARLDGARVSLIARPEADGRIALIAPRPLRAGLVRLHLAWEGAVGDEPSGLWRTPGSRSFLVATLDGRGAARVFPCLVGAAQRACHALTLHVPVGLSALASSRLLERRSLGTTVCWRFAATPPITNAMLGFAVGAFASEIAPDSDTSLRVLTPAGTRGPPQATTQVTGWIGDLETLFERRYAYDKLDLLVVPGLPRATLSLPGLVMCRPPTCSRSALRAALARLWTSTLVSPVATDRWLADALATVAARITEPPGPPSIEMARAREAALRLDALPQPGHHPLRNVATLEMIAAWMGEAAFHGALRRFVRRHAHGIVRRADWIAALDDADAEAMCSDLLGRPGLYVIRGEPAGPRRLTLTQTRYDQPDGPLTQATIPLQLRAGIDGEAVVIRCLLRGPITTIELPGALDWVHLNADHIGYYRWLGPSRQVATLTGEARRALTLCERVGLPGDVWAHFELGALPADGLLDALLALLDDPAPAVLTATLHQLQVLMRRLLPDSHREHFGRLIRARLRPLAQRLFDAPEADPALGLAALDVLVTAECPFSRARLHTQAETALADPEWRPEWARIVLPLAAVAADERLFARLMAAFEDETDAARRATLIAALGAPSDPALIQQALDRLPERLRGPEILDLLRPMGRHRAGRERVRAFLEQRFDRLRARFSPRLLARLPGLATDVRTASERSAWATTFASSRLRPPGMTPAVQRMLAVIDRNLRQAAEASAPLRARLARL